VHARCVDEVARRARIVQRRVDGSFRIEIGDVPEHPFRSATLVEIVVNERDPRRIYSWRGKTNATM
jgi:hypothetical protein